LGGLAGGAAHLQSYQAFLTTPASTVLAEASEGKIVALMALAELCGLPSLLFTLLLTSIATDFQVAVLLARYELRVAALRCAKGPFVRQLRSSQKSDERQVLVR